MGPQYPAVSREFGTLTDTEAKHIALEMNRRAGENPLYGETKVELSNVRPEGTHRDWYERIDARCTGCGSVSVIKICSNPYLTIGWGEGAQGILCGGWRT